MEDRESSNKKKSLIDIFSVHYIFLESYLDFRRRKKQEKEDGRRKKEEPRNLIDCRGKAATMRVCPR